MSQMRDVDPFLFLASVEYTRIRICGYGHIRANLADFCIFVIAQPCGVNPYVFFRASHEYTRIRNCGYRYIRANLADSRIFVVAQPCTVDPYIFFEPRKNTLASAVADMGISV